MPRNIANTARGPVEYRLEGSGATVVVLNGGHCSRESRLSHEQLTEYGFSVLTPSRPGYDDTPAGVGKTAQEAGDALSQSDAVARDLRALDRQIRALSPPGVERSEKGSRRKQRMNTPMEESRFVYVTLIATTPQKLWRAITSAAAYLVRNCRRSRTPGLERLRHIVGCLGIASHSSRFL
jgi:hypothetical protein